MRRGALNCRMSFVNLDGTRQEVIAPAGISVMEAALNNGIDGIEADCGGALSCATCHVHIAPEWQVHLSPPSLDELDLLESACETDAESRLACQLPLTAAIDGIVVRVGCNAL